MIKVFICDDHQSFAEGLATYLNGVDDIIVAGQARNGLEALEAAETIPMDVMILDVDMPVMNGEETLKALKKMKPEIKVLMLSSLNDLSLVDKMKHLGAEGFRNKEASIDDIIRAIRQINDGFTVFLMRKQETLNRLSIEYNLKHLTAQEIRVVGFMADGYTVKVISEIMNLSPHTVETHGKTARAKTGAKNAAELVAIALRKGLI